MKRQPTSHHPKHCHLCGRPLQGRGWAYTPNDDPEAQAIVVCRRCRETAPRCDVCGMPMGENHTRLPDGRLICPRCHQTAIYDPDQAQALFEQTARVVSDQLGLGLAVGTGFTLADQRHLQRLAAEADTKPVDDPHKVIGLFTRQGRKRVMYVLYGLPRILFIQTVAHEWGHAWHRENCPLLNDPLTCEGFAEWVAYKALRELGALKQAAAMTERDGLYGEGLRKMLTLEQERQITGVLEFCRRAE